MRKTVSYSSVIIFNLLTIFIFYCWYEIFKPIENYELLNRSNTAKGYITSVEQFSDIVEENDRAVKPYNYYVFEYEFTTSDGGRYFGKDEGYDKIPNELKYLDDENYPVEVNFSERNPSNNRVFKFSKREDSFYSWIIKCSISGIVLILWWSAVMNKIINAQHQEREKS